MKRCVLLHRKKSYIHSALLITKKCIRTTRLEFVKKKIRKNKLRTFEDGNFKTKKLKKDD